MMIPLYKPYITDEGLDAVERVLKSGKLSRGQEVENFEKEFASYVGKKYAIAVNSGTSGLHLLVRAMGWSKGDEVITSPFSYIASGNAILFENVTPVFADIDLSTLNIDPKKIEGKITKKTKGILLVHIFGLPVNQSAIQKIKERYNLQIIEDACEAIGKPSDDFTVTRLGNASVYGFHENKQLTTGGEGGMIVTDDPSIAKKCWSMRDQGRSLEANWINNVILGFNFRMTEMQAALGRKQLAVIDKILEKREKIAKKYSMLLKGVDGLHIPFNSTSVRRSWFLYFIVFDSPEMRDTVYLKLRDAGVVSSSNYFPPIYKFPMYSDCEKNCENTEYVSKRLLALPMFYEMKDEEIEYVADIIKNAFI